VRDALRILASERGIRAAEPADGQPGTLALTLEDDRCAGSMNAALGALAAAGVPVLFFELEGARLSDAFLAMTEAA
jgi:ABC-2 type transport system ATP-binding protein